MPSIFPRHKRRRLCGHGATLAAKPATALSQAVCRTGQRARRGPQEARGRPLRHPVAARTRRPAEKTARACRRGQCSARRVTRRGTAASPARWRRRNIARGSCVATGQFALAVARGVVQRGGRILLVRGSAFAAATSRSRAGAWEHRPLAKTEWPPGACKVPCACQEGAKPETVRLCSSQQRPRGAAGFFSTL